MKRDNQILTIIIVTVLCAILIFLIKPGENKNQDVSYQTICESNNGIWLPEYQECEYLSNEVCTNVGGTFEECGSACRHEKENGPCTMNCVPYCKF